MWQEIARDNYNNILLVIMITRGSEGERVREGERDRVKE